MEHSESFEEPDSQHIAVVYTGKGLRDLRSLGEQEARRGDAATLNLCGNVLTSLAGVTAWASLHRLDVSHNRLTTLDGLQGLSSLESLRAASNQISKLGALTALTSLTELTLCRNRIADAGELAVLAALPRLQQLAVWGNPVTRGAPSAARMATLAMLTPLRGRLRFLDAILVGDAGWTAASQSPSWSDIVAADSIDQQQQRPWRSEAQQMVGGMRLPGSSGSTSTTLHRTGGSSSSVMQGEAQPPSFESAAQLLPKLQRPVLKASSLRAPPKVSRAKEPPVIYFSTRHTNGMPSITLRRNGTGSFSWPTGSLAASADIDAAGGYRLLAMYDAAGAAAGAAAVALSADASSGFAQYPGGRVAVAWKRSGAGAHTAPDGTVVAKWSGRRAGPVLQEDMSQDLGQGMSLTYVAATGDCRLRIDLSPLHPEFGAVLLSQQEGISLERQEAESAEGAPATAGLVPAAGGHLLPPAAVAAGVATRPPQPQRLRSLRQHQEHQEAPASSGHGSQAGGGQLAAAAAQVASADSTIGGGDEGLAAVIARARALMARTDAEAVAQAEQQQQQAGAEQ